MGASRRISRPRSLIVAALLTAAALAVGPVATAATFAADPSDSGTATNAPTGGYAATPQIDVKVHEPVCDGDVPYLNYQVEVSGTPHDTVTITWQNPDGPDVVQAGLPLSGRVLWPGATVDAQGNPTGWPGWVQVDGRWVEGGPYTWARQPVQVLFEVNPHETVTVSYPPATPTCSANPPGERSPDMNVRVLAPVCANGAAYLDYALDVTGTPNNTATITWHNPAGGADHVQSNVPLAGRVLWPGAYPKRDVSLSAAQGWHLVHNMWINTGQYPWATGTLSVTFAVNPERTVSVTYPPASACSLDAPPAPGTNARAAAAHDPDAGSLAHTGAQILPYAAVAAGLTAAGLLLLAARRRRGSAGGEEK